MKLFIFLVLISTHTFAQIKSGYLTAEDQKYYKNDSFDGNNQRERIDDLVKETNKLHQMIASLRAEIQALKKDVEELRKTK